MAGGPDLPPTTLRPRERWIAQSCCQLQARNTSKSTQTEQEIIHEPSRPTAVVGASPESPDAELIKRALLSLRFFPPAPNLPHLHRLLAVAYREDHGSIGAETALADGARVRSDTHEAAAGGERVHADRVGVRRKYGLGNVR